MRVACCRLGYCGISAARVGGGDVPVDGGCSVLTILIILFFFFFQAEDGIRDWSVTGVQTCALPIYVDYSSEMDNKLREISASQCLTVPGTRKNGAPDPEIGRASCRERV